MFTSCRFPSLLVPCYITRCLRKTYLPWVSCVSWHPFRVVLIPLRLCCASRGSWTFSILWGSQSSPFHWTGPFSFFPLFCGPSLFCGFWASSLLGLPSFFLVVGSTFLILFSMGLVHRAVFSRLWCYDFLDLNCPISLKSFKIPLSLQRNIYQTMHTLDITLSYKNPPHLTILEGNAQVKPLGLEFQIPQVLCKSTKSMRIGTRILMADSFSWNSSTYMYMY